MEISCWFQCPLDQPLSVFQSPYNYFQWLWGKQRYYWVCHQKIEANILSTNCLKYCFDANLSVQMANNVYFVHLLLKKKKKKNCTKCRISERSLQPDMAAYISLNNNSNWILLVLMTAPLTCHIEHIWQEQLQSGWPIDPVTWKYFIISAFSDFWNFWKMEKM